MTSSSKSDGLGYIPRAKRFLRRPWQEKVYRARRRWYQFVGQVPVPVRLPLGIWWFKRQDDLGRSLRRNTFEAAEISFVQRFLRPGMRVLDIGAHNGLYSLLASRCVGSSGRVVAFEPSPRERRALRMNLALNLAWNVHVVPLALGAQEGFADLYVVQGDETGCNSLRPPTVYSSTKLVRVQISTLDKWQEQQRISFINFIKLDVEGAELDVLRGARRLLASRPRPVLMVEAQDVRTQPWGYAAKDILLELRNVDYQLFGLLPDGSLIALDLTPELFEGNFVCCPSESTSSLIGLTGARP